jgi:hypothetical protein
LALESPNIDDDIVGLEMTNVVFEEVMKMTSMERVMAVVSRVGRYPSMKQGGPSKVQCWGTANGPTKNHWLYDVHMGKHDEVMVSMTESLKRPFFKIFKQPPGLIRLPTGGYAPNPAAENIKWLKQGYATYFAQLLRPDPEIQAYVMGDFADLTAGKVVYPQFRRDLHVIKYDEFVSYWSKQGDIFATFDFGRTPVCLLGVRRQSGGIVIFEEICAENSSIDQLFTQYISPILKQKYPRCQFDFATGDPAGADRTQAVETSPFAVLQKYGVPIEFPMGRRKDDLAGRIEATRMRIGTLDRNGVPMMQITDNCKRTIDAFASAYVYESVRGGGDVVRDVPTKSHNNFCSDLANAVEYMCFSQHADMQPERAKKVRSKLSLFKA